MANSTVMFSGINPEGRNSSKVLRPPGGGSSLGPFHCDQPEEARATKQEVAAPPSEPVAEQVREGDIHNEDPSSMRVYLNDSYRDTPFH